MRPPVPSRPFGLLGLVLLLIPARTCDAVSYHPLDVGTTWDYFSATEGDELVSIIGEREVLGALTRIRRHVRPEDTWENYWSQDDGGNLFIHGARSITDPSFEVAYLPPIRMVDSPLYEGKTWVTEDVRLYDLDGNPWPDEPFDYPLRVYSEGIVAVPAGEFYAFGVGYDAVDGRSAWVLRSGRDISGRLWRPDKGRDNTSHWYAVDVGVVQFFSGDAENPFRLVFFEVPPVGTVSTTWGRIRDLYRVLGARR